MYAGLKPEIDRVLEGIEQDDQPREPGSAESSSSIRAVAWNIERGIQLDGIVDVLRSDARLASGDVYLLTEVDYGMARAANRHVAREIAQALGLAWVFAPCYLALNKGAGVEAEAEGENTQALHGNALMSRHPLLRVHTLALPNGKDKMAGREKRLGSQRAIVADVDHPSGMFRAVVVHLDAHSTQRHRHLQMKLVLDHLDSLEPGLPALIGGDWNTTTHDASRALYSILGYCRRVLMGVRGVLANHYPYPDRWFERHLFREIESRGYRYRDLNVPGGCTLHYSIQDLAANRNMGEWIPQWCFWFINWALEEQGGRCSLKLDWFAGKGIRPDQSDKAAVVRSWATLERRALHCRITTPSCSILRPSPTRRDDLEVGMKSLVTSLIVVLLCGCASEPASPAGGTAAETARAETTEADEEGALEAVQAIVAAQDVFSAMNRRYALTVAELMGAMTLEDDPTRRDTGYTIRMRGTPAADGYRITAEPPDGAVDKRSFFADASGVIRSELGQPAGADSPGLDEESVEEGPSS